MHQTTTVLGKIWKAIRNRLRRESTEREIIKKKEEAMDRYKEEFYRVVRYEEGKHKQF